MCECKRYGNDDDDVDVDVDDEEVHSHGKCHHGTGFSSTTGIHIPYGHHTSNKRGRWQDSYIKLKWMISYGFCFWSPFFFILLDWMMEANTKNKTKQNKNKKLWRTIFQRFLS